MIAVLLGLAVYRVWRIIALDSITEPLRAPLIARTDQRVWGWVWDLLSCPWCIGFWLNGVGAWVLAGDFREFILWWFGGSTVTGLCRFLDPV